MNENGSVEESHSESKNEDAVDALCTLTPLEGILHFILSLQRLTAPLPCIVALPARLIPLLSWQDTLFGSCDVCSLGANQISIGLTVLHLFKL